MLPPNASPLELLGPRCPKCTGPCYVSMTGVIACVSSTCAWLSRSAASGTAAWLDAPASPTVSQVEEVDVPRAGRRAKATW